MATTPFQPSRKDSISQHGNRPPQRNISTRPWSAVGQHPKSPFSALRQLSPVADMPSVDPRPMHELKQIEQTDLVGRV
jgi:hypothetical protein